MLRNAIWMTFFGLVVGGCASDANVQQPVEPSRGTSSTADGAAVSSPAMPDVAPTEPTSTSSKKSDVVAAEPSSTSPAMSSAAATESNPTNQSKSTRNRIAAGVEEETLDTCVAGIPEGATVGQKMLAEQTCRRDYAGPR